METSISLSATTRSTASAADKTVGSRELFRHFGLWIGLAVLALICIAPVQPGLSEAGQRMIGIMFFAVIVWASNAVSYPVSAGVILALMAMLIGFDPSPTATPSLVPAPLSKWLWPVFLHPPSALWAPHSFCPQP